MQDMVYKSIGRGAGVAGARGSPRGAGRRGGGARAVLSGLARQPDPD